MAKYVNGLPLIYAENVTTNLSGNIVDVRYLETLRVHYRVAATANGTLRIQASCYPFKKDIPYNWVDIANFPVTGNGTGIHSISNAAFTVLRVVWEHTSGSSAVIEAYLGGRG